MTSRQAKLQEDTYFRVMRILQENPDLTQRELAEKKLVAQSALDAAEADRASRASRWSEGGPCVRPRPRRDAALSPCW